MGITNNKNGGQNPWKADITRASISNETYRVSKKKWACVLTYITSKQIELESPGWSGFEPASKSDQLRLSSSIRLDVM